MNVLLIIPPSAFLIDDRVFPSLGVLKVAAVLEREGHAVSVLDLAGERDMAARIDAVDGVPDTIGITAVTPQMPAATAILALLRDRFPGVPVILGGPHVTLTMAARKGEAKRGVRGRGHAAAKRLEEMFDVLVAGDGERAVLAAIAPGARGLIDADDRASPYWMDRDAYEESPWPARHLIDLQSYRYEIEGRPATSLIAQLGCPFHCGFCGGRNSPSLRVTRTRSTENVVAELRHLYETYGYTGIMFYDDEINVNPGLVGLMDAVTALQDEIGVEFRLRGFVKAELLTDAQAAAMKRAGFRWLLCGFEAAHPRILTNIRKRATVEDNTRVMEIADRHGLKVKALMSIGHPGESDATVRAVEDWLLDVCPADFDCTVITPYPGTPYHDEAEPNSDGTWTYAQPETGDRLHMLAPDFETRADYYKGIPGQYRSMVFTDHLDRDEIVSLRDALEETVRARLAIPFPSAAVQFEHSMGQA